MKQTELQKLKKLSEISSRKEPKNFRSKAWKKWKVKDDKITDKLELEERRLYVSDGGNFLF